MTRAIGMRGATLLLGLLVTVLADHGRFARANPKEERAHGRCGGIGTDFKIERVGRGGIVGIARRDGQPLETTIEVHLVRSITSGEPDVWRWGRAGVWAILDEIRTPSRPVALAASDRVGRFLIVDLLPGVYAVVAVDASGRRGASRVVVPVTGAVGEVRCDIRVGRHTLAGTLRAGTRPFLGTVFFVPGWDLELLPGSIVGISVEGGQFIMRGLPPGSGRIVAVDATGRISVSTLLKIPRDRTVEMNVDEVDSTIAGRVVDAMTGNPIIGAEVLCDSHQAPLSPGESPRSLHPVRTASDGSFSCRLFQYGLSGQVRALGYEPRWFEPHAGKRDCVLRMRRTARIVGRVVDGNGRGVPGVRVISLPAANQPLGASVGLSACDGTFEIADAHSGERTVFAFGGGWVSKHYYEVQNDGFNPLAVDVVPGRTTRVELAVEPAKSVQGLVRDSAKRPVAGALVSVGSTKIGLNMLTATLSGPDGRYQVYSLRHAPKRVEARYPGFCTACVGECKKYIVGHPRTLTTANLTLRPARVVRAVVTDAVTGDPIDGALVSASQSNGFSVIPSLSPVASARTASSGRACLELFPRGPTVFSASAPGYIDHEHLGVDDDGWKRGVPIDMAFKLRPGKAIAGHVRFEDNKPVVGAMVSGVPGTFRQADMHGAFRFDGLPPGTYDLKVGYDFFDRAPRARIKIKAGSEDVLIVLPRPKPDREPKKGLEIRVVGPDGEAVPRARILFVSAGEGAWAERVSAVRAGSALVPANTAGWWIEVWDARTTLGDPLPFGALKRRPVPDENTDIEVRLPAEKRIVGRVVDTDGTGIAGVTVRARAPRYYRHAAAVHGSDHTTKDGSFTLGGLWDGEYEVEILGPPSMKKMALRTLRAGARGVRIVLAPR